MRHIVARSWHREGGWQVHYSDGTSRDESALEGWLVMQRDRLRDWWRSLSWRA